MNTGGTNKNVFNSKQYKTMGQDDFNAGALATFMWLGTILLSIGSGILAWNWVEPHSFLGAVGFIILWGILSKVGHFIMFGIIYAMFGRD